MDIINKRFLLFIFGCIGSRLLFVYISKIINIKYLPILGYLSIIPSLGFFYIYFIGSRDTGPEVFGSKIWWNYLRPLHGFLYLLFALNAINKNKNSWKFLLIDVITGLIAFLYYNYSEGNLYKLKK